MTIDIDDLNTYSLNFKYKNYKVDLKSIIKIDKISQCLVNIETEYLEMEHHKNKMIKETKIEKYIKNDKNKINNEIITKYHLPLRYQGNFIKKSIENFNTISNALYNKDFQTIKNITDKPILYNLKDLLHIDNDDSFNNTNLVIFTCMRLDQFKESEEKIINKQQFELYTHIIKYGDKFDLHPVKFKIDDSDEIKNIMKLKDSYNAIKRSLEFSHCVNPVRDTKYENEICTRGSKGGSKPRYPVVTPPISSSSLNTSMLLQQTGGFSLSPLAINFVQLTCFMYAIKIIRWTYYKEYNKKDKSNTTFYRKMFVDYSLNLMMLIFLHATRQTDLLYTFLFDEIISIVLLMKTGNEDVLLYPYYVGIMPFSISKMVR